MSKFKITLKAKKWSFFKWEKFKSDSSRRKLILSKCISPNLVAFPYFLGSP
jgi:hypothetical protein